MASGAASKPPLEEPLMGTAADPAQQDDPWHKDVVEAVEDWWKTQQASVDELLHDTEFTDLARVCAICMIAFLVVVELLSYLGIFGYVGVLVYLLLLLAVVLWPGAELIVLILDRMQWCKDESESIGCKFRSMVKAVRHEAWTALFHTEHGRKGHRTTLILWFGPMFFSAFGLFSQMWLLHVSTYYYIMSMDRLELTLDDDVTHGGSRGHVFDNFQGPFGGLTPGVNGTEVSFGSNPDVIEAMMSYQDVSIGVLDKVAALWPMLFAALAVRSNELPIWSKAMFSNGILAILKGIIGAVTIVPDSSGWQNCQARLGADSVDYFRQGLPNPFKEGVFYNVFEIMRTEVDGMRHNRVLSGIRWCADMMFSGHTYFTFLYSVATLELLSRWYARNQGTGALACCVMLAAFVVLSQCTELYLVLHNRFHYTSDVLVAILLVLLLYSNGPMAILAHWWSFRLRRGEEDDDRALPEDRRAPLLWVPPLCCPLCCIPKMVGFHTMNFERDDHVLEEELLHVSFGQAVRGATRVECEANCQEVVWRGVIVDVDIGAANEGATIEDYSPSEARYEVLAYAEGSWVGRPDHLQAFWVKESDVEPLDGASAGEVQSRVLEGLEQSWPVALLDHRLVELDRSWSDLRKQKVRARLEYRGGKGVKHGAAV